MTISAVVVARDEEEMIDGALRLLGFCDEIVVVVDERTSDRTEEIARRYTEQVYRLPFDGFGSFKSAGVERARGDWIVFCDGDERVTPRLAREFRTELERGTDMWGYRSPTINFFWGRRMNYGGWRETHTKLVRRDHARYAGDVHERLGIPADRIGWLAGERWHFSHRSIEENLKKTIRYGGLDADERYAAGAPPVTIRSVVRAMGYEVARRLVRRTAWRDGIPGLIEAVYQPFSVFCAQVMLWERQQGEAIARAYVELERAAGEQE